MTRRPRRTLCPRSLLAAALALSVGGIAEAAEARAGRLSIEANGGAWQAQSNLPFSVPSTDSNEFGGGGALLHYADAGGRTVATFFIGATWNVVGAAMSATCRSGRDGYLREIKPDGFVTHGCAMASPLLPSNQLALAAPRLTPHVVIDGLPERGHVLSAVVATKNGGVIIVQGFVDASFGMKEPYDWPWGTPKPIPLATAAYVGALGDAAVNAAKAVFPRFVFPPVALAPDTQTPSASK